MKIITEIERVSLKRSVEAGTEEQRRIVEEIIREVREKGDEALRAYTRRFDQVELEQFLVTDQEIKQAFKEVSTEVVLALQEAIRHIRAFHERQKRNSWFQPTQTGTILGQLVRPLDRVGVYVPGGTAAYPSSVLMNVIPAQVAGVEEIIMVTPPLADGKVAAGVLVAADLLGVNRVYKVGGAQAIAALAYGTETIPRVDKIVGPGNIYVALAKRAVYGDVAIDMIAGPSEIVVLADEGQNPEYIASDLLSQAEHDPRSSSVCVTTCLKLAQRVQQEVERQLSELPREAIAREAIENYGAIYVAQSMEEAIEIVNTLAPEHLEVLVADPWSILGQIKHAGAIFIGEYSSEPVGDYFAGPNHVLPTNGTARFSSPLNVDDFMKKSSLIFYSRDDLLASGEKIMHLARYEGLEGHARAIEVRLNQLKKGE